MLLPATSDSLVMPPAPVILGPGATVVSPPLPLPLGGSGGAPGDGDEVVVNGNDLVCDTVSVSRVVGSAVAVCGSDVAVVTNVVTA